MGESEAIATKTGSRWLHPSRALLVASVILPLVIFGLAALQNRRDVLREAGTRVDRTLGALHEHALKVFESHLLVIDRINERLRAIDWSDDAARSELHDMLVSLQDLDQVATITIVDAQGFMLASSRVFPNTPDVNFADRDWFKALKEKPIRGFVSRSYTGRQSGVSVFNVAARMYSPDKDRFGGVISISVDRSYFENFYKTIDPSSDHTVSLLREDGVILARDPATQQLALGTNSPFLMSVKRGVPNGSLSARSAIDGVERIFNYQKIGSFPVYVALGISIDAALDPWRRNLASYGVVAVLAATAMFVISWMALGQAAREREALMQLQIAAEGREAAEDALRQAQKMEAVGRLTGGLAHDFNNLLTAILGNLDLLKRRLGDGDPRLHTYAERASEGARRAATLTQRLLAFSRQQPLRPEAIDINKLVGGMSDLFNRTLGEQIEIETVTAGGLWRCRVDANQLESAILNLAVNARDAMPDGGKITIETGNCHLDEAYAAAHADVTAGQYVMIAVSDTGTGMPADVAARAFDPFYTTKPQGMGTGLGLSQVYGFVKQSGGHVKIYSELAQGTTLKLYLPRLPQAEAITTQEAALQSPAPARGNETIMVVEDEDSVRAFAVETLRDHGYRVIHASNGDEALRKLREHPAVDLLFTDVVMPGNLNGRKLADAARKENADLKVLFTTGYTQNAIVHNGTLDPDAELLSKPFTIPALTAKVRAMLDGAC